MSPFQAIRENSTTPPGLHGVKIQASSPDNLNVKDVLRTLSSACAQDMDALETLLIHHLTHDVALITQITHHLIIAGGKRLRPLLALACCHAVHGSPSDKMIDLAASLELIHNATLLHDDVIDESTMRRGKPTANALWGNKASILVGDFLFAKSFELMLGENDAHVLPILAKVCQTITAGEVLQLSHMNTFDLQESILLEIMHCKTAALFAAATEISAALFNKDLSLRTALYNFGHNLGMAFQVVDDVLDYTGSTENLGKKVGDDLTEGKVTLPLFYAYQNAHDGDKETLESALGSLNQMDDVVRILHDTQALDRCHILAQNYAHNAVIALDALPDSHWKIALTQLSHSLITRIQ